MLSLSIKTKGRSAPLEEGFGISRVADLADFALGFSGFSKKSCGFSGQLFQDKIRNLFYLDYFQRATGFRHFSSSGFGYCSKNVRVFGF